MSWGYNFQQRRTIQGTVPTVEQIADAVIRKLTNAQSEFSDEFGSEFHSTWQICYCSAPTAEQIADAVLKKMSQNCSVSEFSGEFGSEFQAKTSVNAQSEFSNEFGSELQPIIDDWRPRVIQLEEFQVAATDELYRQKNINNELVKIGILEQPILNQL
jgi:hypothetical protein